MVVIKRGIPKASQLWRGQCRSCGSEAEAQECEMTHITEDQREGGRFSWEKCPVCGLGGTTGYGGMLFYPHGR
jgi:hypothetical protein